MVGAPYRALYGGVRGYGMTEQPKKMKYYRNTLSKKIFIYAMIFWPILHFLIFWVYINFNTIILSLQRFSVNSGDYVFIGIDNYKNLFRQLFEQYPDRMLLDAVLNSLSLFLFSNFLLLPLSVISGYVLSKKVFMAGAFRVIFYLPSIISMVVLTMCFKFMFDPKLGIVTPILNGLGLGGIIPEFGWFANVKTAWGMVLFYSLWAGIGYNVLLLTGAFSRIPRDIIESAKLDGIGFWRELWSITLPLISSTLNTLIIIGTTSVLTTFLQPMLLTGGGPNNSTYTIMYYVTAMVKSGANGICSAATLGVFVSVIAIPLLLGFRKLLNKLLPSIEF